VESLVQGATLGVNALVRGASSAAIGNKLGFCQFLHWGVLPAGLICVGGNPKKRNCAHRFTNSLESLPRNHASGNGVTLPLKIISMKKGAGQ
jgi:hypothetical protein